MRRLTAALLSLGLVAGPAQATWSVVVVNLKTGEVCSATATCVSGEDLDLTVPVIVVGKGAGAAQALVYSNAKNRKIMFQGFKDSIPSREILAQIDAGDVTDFRQFGIICLVGDPVTFTGPGLGGDPFQYAGGVARQHGDLLYAIQGNSITGEPVIDLAEQALLNTPGTLSDRVMAAMVAAGAMGGDGRCSCSADADSCGSPPPNFSKSAHQAVIALARIGDQNGTCSGNAGCINGDYYLFMEETGGPADSDPVTRLDASYQAWRSNLVGMADHLESQVAIDQDVLPADGESQARVRVRLVDLDGTPLTLGGDSLSFERLRGGQLRARPGGVIDKGDGTYEFELTATHKTGREHWAVVVERPGQRPVQLGQTVVVETVPPSELMISHYSWSASEGGAVLFRLDRGPLESGRGYVLAGTNLGTMPGFDLPGGVHVPLNRGRFMDWTLTPGTGRLGFAGVLDVDGQALARLNLSPQLGSILVGERLHFAAVLQGATYDITELVSIPIFP